MRLGGRERVVLIIAAGMTLLVAVVVVLVVLLNDDSAGNGDTAAKPVETAGAPANPRCPDDVTVLVDTDDGMRRASEQLRNSPQVRAIFTETKQEAYERFKVIFKDQPDLVDKARPESLPASVRVSPVPGVTGDALARQLRAEFPDPPHKIERAVSC